MTPGAPPKPPLEALTGLLDEQIALLDLRRIQLASLCGAILDRDEDAVGRLLDQIERAQELQAATDAKLHAARRALAEAMGCQVERMKLSWLIGRLSGPARGELAERRGRIIELAGALQRENTRAVVLVTECARLNRLLLESLLPRSEGLKTYGAGGTDDWQPDAGLVDAER